MCRGCLRMAHRPGNVSAAAIGPDVSAVVVLRGCGSRGRSGRGVEAGRAVVEPLVAAVVLVHRVRRLTIHSGWEGGERQVSRGSG